MTYLKYCSLMIKVFKFLLCTRLMLCFDTNPLELYFLFDHFCLRFSSICCVVISTSSDAEHVWCLIFTMNLIFSWIDMEYIFCHVLDYCCVWFKPTKALFLFDHFFLKFSSICCVFICLINLEKISYKYKFWWRRCLIFGIQHESNIYIYIYIW